MSKKFISYDSEGIGDFRTKTFMDPRGQILDETKGPRDLNIAIGFANKELSAKSSKQNTEDAKPIDANIFIQETKRENLFPSTPSNNIEVMKPQSITFSEPKELSVFKRKSTDAEYIPEGEVMVPSEMLRILQQEGVDQNQMNKVLDKDFLMQLEQIQKDEYEKGFEKIESGVCQNQYKTRMDSNQVVESGDSNKFRKPNDLPEEESTLEMKKNFSKVIQTSGGRFANLNDPLTDSKVKKNARISNNSFGNQEEEIERELPKDANVPNQEPLSETINESDIIVNKYFPPDDEYNSIPEPNYELIKALQSNPQSNLSEIPKHSNGIIQNNLRHEVVYKNLISGQANKKNHSSLPTKDNQVFSGKGKKGLPQYHTEDVGDRYFVEQQPTSKKVVYVSELEISLRNGNNKLAETKDSLKFY